MGYATPLWPYFIVICLCLTLIAWIEDIKKFSVTFLVGNLLIFTTVLAVSGYCIWMLASEGAGPEIPVYSASGFWATVGFAIYSYEGIGIVMPVLSKAEQPESFLKCLMAAIGTLSFIFVGFGLLTSLTFGANLTEPFITQMLPAGYWSVSLLKIAYTGNLICSYPIMVKPCNEILESYLFKRYN